MARRQHLILTVLLAFVFLSITGYLYSGPDSLSAREAARMIASVRSTGAQRLLKGTPKKPGSKPDLSKLPGDLLNGGAIAPKLENATIKAELGRATWKFLHTTAAQFPEHPTTADRETFEFFFRLMPRVYPCGDCAQHFGELLKQMPPQTSSRNALAGWLCEAHNKVNKRLQKPMFDCSKIGDFYDCGCGDKDKAGGDEGKGKKDDEDTMDAKGGKGEDDTEKKKGKTE